MYARRVFYKIDTTSPLNPEAAVLYVTFTLLRRINLVFKINVVFKINLVFKIHL